MLIIISFAVSMPLQDQTEENDATAVGNLWVTAVNLSAEDQAN